MDPTLLRLDPAAPEPLYRQLVAQVARLVAAGVLRAGDTLPSVRDVAAAHAINPMTVSRAWGLLEADGLVLRERGRGMVVAGDRRRAAPLADRLALLAPALEALALQARDLELPAERVLAALRQRLQEPSA